MMGTFGDGIRIAVMMALATGALSCGLFWTMLVISCVTTSGIACGWVTLTDAKIDWTTLGKF